ncbi:MAG: DUF1499 domain-containing protein [Novosphingobium sp.]|nr:DUF1499 domain-containing protein [Novosphingobium sp.]
MARAKWAGRLGGIAKYLGLGAVIVGFAGATLARYDIVAKLPGFGGIAVGLLLAAIGFVVAVLALLIGMGKTGATRKPAVWGLVLSGAYLGVIASYMIPAADYPPIHDATTDLANPPEFAVLPMREDNLVGVGTIENWQKIHAEAFPDLKPVTIAKPVAEVIADADRIAKGRGWTVAAADPDHGRFEATAYAAYIRFRDDVVLRVVPSEDGASSTIDMRSVSQVGGGDLGYNANRVRSFLKELQGD